MQGKQVLITGSTQGIGKAAAKRLSQMGASVTIHGRDLIRCEAVANEIREADRNADVDILVCDLSSLKAVKAAAAAYQAKHPTLDVLALNAGVFLSKREVSEDGFEKSFAMGFLGHYALTQILLPSLQASGDGRIITVAAPLDGVKVDFSNLQLEKSYSFMKAVPQSKALLVMYILGLTKHYAGKGVSANYMHPGLNKTNLLKEMPWLLRTLLSIFGSPPEKGADTLVYLASEPSLKGVTGKYFHNRKDLPFKGMVADEANWNKAMEIGKSLAGI